jgi:hypothetical protein
VSLSLAAFLEIRSSSASGSSSNASKELVSSSMSGPTQLYTVALRQQ